MFALQNKCPSIDKRSTWGCRFQSMVARWRENYKSHWLIGTWQIILFPFCSVVAASRLTRRPAGQLAVLHSQWAELERLRKSPHRDQTGRRIRRRACEKSVLVVVISPLPRPPLSLPPSPPPLRLAACSGLRLLTMAASWCSSWQ